MTNEVAQLKKAIADAEQTVLNGKKFLALQKEPLFGEVILNGYVFDGINDLVDDLARITDPQERAESLRKLEAIAIFRNWLNDIIRNAQQAEAELVELKEALTDAESELE